MNKTERQELKGIIRRRLKVLRQDVEARRRELYIAVDEQLEAEYHADLQRWDTLQFQVDEALREANRKINDLYRDHFGKDVWGTESERMLVSASKPASPDRERTVERNKRRAKVDATVAGAYTRLGSRRTARLGRVGAVPGRRPRPGRGVPTAPAGAGRPPRGQLRTGRPAAGPRGVEPGPLTTTDGDTPMSRMLDTVPMSPRIARLPRNDVGYPIPWFVETLDDGTRDFRIMSARRFADALRFELCWVCGQPRGRWSAFTIGPMCSVNRISGEPPAHRDCAIYAARVCPFLSTPNFRRRETGKPADTVPAAGHMITRNPGVALVWVTRSFSVFHPDRGEPGILIEIGDPTETLWFARGREATRAEVMASIESGLPLLREQCDMEAEGARASAHAELDRQVDRALRLVPA